MTTQIYNAELFELMRSRFQDKGEPGSFAYNQIIPWIDFPLNDTVDGQHFNDNNSSYPTSWTEVDAAPNTSTNDIYGFWRIIANNSNTSWKYRKQLSVNIETDIGDPGFFSLLWGPILLRDAQLTNDLNYYLGIYRNSGGIDETTFNRVNLQWDSSGGQWRVRGQHAEGGATTSGSWFTFSQHPLPGALFFRQTIEHDSTNPELRRSYVGLNNIAVAQLQLQSDNLANTTTWGQVWAQCHMTRAATGIADVIWIGGIDTTNNA